MTITMIQLDEFLSEVKSIHNHQKLFISLKIVLFPRPAISGGGIIVISN